MDASDEEENEVLVRTVQIRCSDDVSSHTPFGTPTSPTPPSTPKVESGIKWCHRAKVYLLHEVY